jgi:hypothetical protein
MGRLKEWALDWVDRSDTQPSERKIQDPITVLQRSVAALAGLLAILSSPAIGVLVPDLNPNAAIVLRIAIALVTLVAVNYVVTAKDTAEAEPGAAAKPVRRYRYSNTERLIARGVIAAAILVLALNLVPAPTPPRDCSLTATVEWQPPGTTAKPLFLALTTGGRVERYPVEAGTPVAMQVPAVHLSGYSVALLWSDNSRSEFGELSECAAAVTKESEDGRATIALTGR